MDLRNIACFTSKNILSKVTLKHDVSILTTHPVHPKIHFRIIRAVNPLSQLYINQKFQKYVSVSICHCHRASFMKSLFIAYNDDEWRHLVVRIDSLAFISFYCVWVASFYFSIFNYFLWSLLFAEVLRQVCQYLK